MSRKSRNEFRYNFNTHHPNYIFYEDDNKYRSIGLTHSPYWYSKKNGKKYYNVRLNQNPNIKDSRNSYMRYGIISDKKKNYGKVLDGFKFSDSDFKNIRSKSRNYKNYVRKNKKNK